MSAFVLALVVALLLTPLFVLAFGWRRGEDESGWATALFVFMLLLFGLWASTFWLVPAGPLVGGVAWVPLLLVGVILLLIVAAASPVERSPAGRRADAGVATPLDAKAEPARRQVDREGGWGMAALGGVFWVLLIMLFVVIAIGFGTAVA